MTKSFMKEKRSSSSCNKTILFHQIPQSLETRFLHSTTMPSPHGHCSVRRAPWHCCSTHDRWHGLLCQYSQPGLPYFFFSHAFLNKCIFFAVSPARCLLSEFLTLLTAWRLEIKGVTQSKEHQPTWALSKSTRPFRMPTAEKQLGKLLWEQQDWIWGQHSTRVQCKGTIPGEGQCSTGLLLLFLRD